MTYNEGDQLRAAVDAAPIPMAVTRISDGLILHANALLGQFFGLQSHKMIGRNSTRDYYYDLADRDESLMLIERQGYVRVRELRLRKADGSPCWVVLSMRRVAFDGEAALISGFYDVTERREAEEALRERSHDLGERVKELNCLYDISKLVDQPGISLQEIAQGTAEIIIPSWQYPEVTCAQITLEGQEFSTDEWGESPWRQSSEIIVRGEPVGVVEVCYREERPESDEGPFLKEERSLIEAIAQKLGEVTDRKRIEAALRDSEHLHRMVVESVSEIIYLVHLEGDPLAGSFRFGNTRMKEILGYDTDEFRSDPGLWLRVIHPDDLPQVDETTRHMFATGESTTREYRMRHKESDRYVWLEDKVVPQVDETGKTVSFLGVARDITIRKQTEEALQKEREELEHEVETVIQRGSPFGLTFREHTVLRLVAKGQTDKAIGALLSISRRTVNKHVENILAKMRCSSRSEATAMAFREHLMD